VTEGERLRLNALDIQKKEGRRKYGRSMGRSSGNIDESAEHVIEWKNRGKMPA